eukprot:GHRR01035078.1.p1 GENE.GHRR01035078.1~~GHRR01035078.1.p1  ORF type:complete len:131 (-),score=20.70 GHRR01035078.1:403-795(-)
MHNTGCKAAWSSHQCGLASCVLLFVCRIGSFSRISGPQVVCSLSLPDRIAPIWLEATGSLPVEFLTVNKLRSVVLQGNKLSGTLPEQLTELQVWDVSVTGATAAPVVDSCTDDSSWPLTSAWCCCCAVCF